MEFYQEIWEEIVKSEKIRTNDNFQFFNLIEYV
jgi:hypothetical protein